MSDLHWILDDDLPANFWHDIRHDEKDENPVGSAFLTVQRPASPPSDADDPWPFVTTLSSVRQSLMDEISNGSNALIWPVRWRPSGSYWTEDSQGRRAGRPHRPHAAYDRLTAALRHAGFLQRRRCRAMGAAAWFAAGSMDRDRLRAPARRRRQHARPMKYPGPKRARFVGMHVVDLKSGHVLSALLGSANLKAAARSANGRFLRWARPTPQAAGSIASHSGTSHRAAHPRSSTHRRYPEQRRWPFRGAVRLWALGTRELMLWQLPAALRDHATRGAAPDQSRN